MITHIQERIKAMFSDLIFEDQRHLYFVNNVRLPSVTGLVENHSEPFDEAKWLPICSRKEGITEHELKHQWQTTNKEACDLGTETHDFLEHYTGLETPSTPQQEAGVQFLKDIMADYYILFKELRMYSRKYWYAGTADLLLMHKTTGKLVLADYKTNKDLFKTFGLLKSPFQYLENHPYSKYQLQLSYYDLILQEINCSISERLLVYLKADGTYKIYSTFDFSTQLETHLQSQKKAA